MIINLLGDERTPYYDYLIKTKTIVIMHHHFGTKIDDCPWCKINRGEYEYSDSDDHNSQHRPYSD